MKSITEEITIIENEYFKDLQEIKEIIKRNRNKAMVIVNSAMIISYYETGVVINKRKKWGKIPWRTLIEIIHKSSNHNEIILLSLFLKFYNAISSAISSAI